MTDSRPSRPWRRLLLVVVPASAVIGLLGFGLRNAAGPPAPGDEAPHFRAPLLAGDGLLDLSELRGEPVVLNFWASWCEPCVDEAPAFRRAHREYGDEIAFVGVDVRDDEGDALEFVAEHDLDYRHIRDEDLSIYDDYGLTGQPETFFLDSDGTIVEHVNGPLLEEDLVALLDELAR